MWGVIETNPEQREDKMKQTAAEKHKQSLEFWANALNQAERAGNAQKVKHCKGWVEYWQEVVPEENSQSETKEDKAQGAVVEAQKSKNHLIGEIKSAQNKRQRGNKLIVKFRDGSSYQTPKGKNGFFQIELWNKDRQETAKLMRMRGEEYRGLQQSCCLGTYHELNEAIKEYIAWVDYFVGVHEKQRTEVLV